MNAPASRRPHVVSFRAARGLPDRALAQRQYTADEIDEAEWHARALERCKWPTAPRLTEAQRELVQEVMDTASRARQRRVEDHVANLQRTARTLGRNVARHEISLADAAERLEALASATDPEMTVPCALVLYPRAVEIISAAFDAGRSDEK